MANPFAGIVPPLSGPARDLAPIAPNDTADLPDVALALYGETGGTLVIDTVAGQTRTVVLADFSPLAVGARRVRATGTTAVGIHALVHG